MEIKTAEDAAKAYKSFDDWKYADREAAWKWMFEQGRMAEREECVKVCNAQAADYSWFGCQPYESMEHGALSCAEAIGARSNAK